MLPETCSQCGNAYTTCVSCGDKIIFVPKPGFGNQGEWRHLEPSSKPGHIPHPKLHVY
jgi:hypothetical protein